LHFAYPYFLTGQPNQSQSHPPIKKSKPTSSQDEAQAHEVVHVLQVQEAQSNTTSGVVSSTSMNSPLDMPQENFGSQGLLEDMVPFMIRNPSNNVNSAHTKFSCSSFRSPPASPLWSSNYSTSCYTVGLNSGT